MSHFERTIDLIGGNVVEALALVFLWERLPIEFCGMQERESSHHISASECEWVFDGAINMRFSCKVDDTIDVFVLHQLIERIEVADIHLHELVIWLILDVLEVGEIASISKLIKVYDVVFWVFVYKESYNMGADEAGLASLISQSSRKISLFLSSRLAKT